MNPIDWFLLTAVIALMAFLIWRALREDNKPTLHHDDGNDTNKIDGDGDGSAS